MTNPHYDDEQTVLPLNTDLLMQQIADLQQTIADMQQHERVSADVMDSKDARIEELEREVRYWQVYFSVSEAGLE